jgi:hypothetical protein
MDFRSLLPVFSKGQELHTAKLRCARCYRGCSILVLALGRQAPIVVVGLPGY